MCQRTIASIAEKGPYKDDGSRMLPYGPKAYGYNKDTCSTACKCFKYFALQNNGWCCCGNDWDKATSLGAANCGKMGGAWCNYVYENVAGSSGGSSPAPAPTPAPAPAAAPGIPGGYKDTGNRAMRNGGQRGFGNDKAICQDRCKDYKYFAL